MNLEREFKPQSDAVLFSSLAIWVGPHFRFQGIEFAGSEECKPCYWMDAAVAPGVEEFLKTRFRGGLRTRLLSDGIMRLA